MRAARACPQHGAFLGETAARVLRCPYGHRVGRWTVVDVETGAVLAVASAERIHYLGPELAGLALRAFEGLERCYAVPRTPRPRAA